VPLLTIEDMIGVINVLFVKISVVFLAIKVSVEVGNDKVPVFMMVDILGLIIVLLVNV
jgi:hypothetical protein